MRSDGPSPFANSDISRDVTGTVGHCFTGAHGWQKAR